MPLFFHKRHFYLSNHPSLSSHPRKRSMYDTMWREDRWPSKATNVHQTVSSCHSCAKTSSTLMPKCGFWLFLEIEPLIFVAMDNLGELHETTKGSQHVVTTTDRYSKLKEEVLTARITATAITYIGFDTWVVQKGIPPHPFSSLGSKSVSKVSDTLRTRLDTDDMKTAGYHPQTSRQIKHHNKAFVVFYTITSAPTNRPITFLYKYWITGKMRKFTGPPTPRGLTMF